MNLYKKEDILQQPQYTVISFHISEEILKGTKDSNLPTENCTPPECSVMEDGNVCPPLEALIPESSEAKVFKL